MAIKNSKNCAKVLGVFGLLLASFTIYLVLLGQDRYVDEQDKGDRSLESPHHRFSRSTKDDCSINLTVTSNGGTLTSPDYPNNYPSNTDCRWVLTTTEPDANIFLKIDSLDIEPDRGCKLDYLQVYQGPTTLAPSLGLFCGVIKGKTLKSNSSQVLLVFHSDDVYEEKGFSIDYFTQTEGDCQALLTAGSGSLRSPGYPDNYPDNTDCWTQITASKGKKILVFFDSIKLEFGDDCGFDYVQIYDGTTQNDTLLGQICDGSGVTNFESSSNFLLIHFHSDDSQNFGGYRARYSSVDKKSSTPVGDCLWETGENNGTVISPNYPNSYPSFSNCTIWIQAPEGQRIFITIDSLHLEMGRNCSYDYLRIKEGTPPDNKILGTFCGKEIEPINLMANESEVEIHFHSDDFWEFSGFKLQYQFVTNETDVFALGRRGEDPEKLVLSQIPENATVSVGSSHMLHCSTDHPYAKITWLKGDQYLESDSSFQGLSVLANGSVWIQHMDHHLSGSYTCIATAPEHIATAKAYVHINDGPAVSPCGIVFRKTPKNASFVEGEFAYMQCLTAGEHIPVTWEKDGRPLESQEHITIQKNGHIFLENVKLEDAGLYTCVAEDTLAECTKKVSARLQVTKRSEIDEICGKPKVGQPSKEVPHKEHGKIVGGGKAKKGAYPWQVMLWEPSLDSFCGGSLLNERWIATAAHCFINYKGLQWNRIVIKLGKYDRERQEDQEFRTAIADPSSIIIHPDFDRITFDNDLALVRLREHVGFTDYILPLCLGNTDLEESLLNINEDSPTIKMGTVIGWGKLKHGGALPRYLQEIKLPIVDQNTCIASTVYNVTSNMFCAGYPQEIIGDACQGDSGGPFLMSYEGRWYLLGIVSWGEGCGKANKYGFYTRVPNYIPWIESIIRS